MTETYTRLKASELVGTSNRSISNWLSEFEMLHGLKGMMENGRLTELALERLEERNAIGKLGYAEKYRVPQVNPENELEHPKMPSVEMERYHPPHLERLARPHEMRIEISAEQLVTLLATAQTRSEITSLQNRTETRDDNSQTLNNTLRRIRDEQAYQRGRLNYRREREIESQGQHDEMQADLAILLRNNQATPKNESHDQQA
jgi:hypothetical protein